MSLDRGAFRTPPAPVVSDEDHYALTPLPDPRVRAPRPRSRVRRAAVQLAVATAIWLLVFSAAQMSTRAAALPALERILAALTDVDGLLALQEQAVRAATSQPGATEVVVPGFPVTSASLPVELARTGTRAQWRSVLLDAGADAIYARGMAAFAQEGRGVDGGPLSTAGNTTMVIDALTAARNRTATFAALLLGVGVLALGARVVRLGEGTSRFVAIGLALVGAAVLACAVSVILASVLLAASLFGSSQLADEVAQVARTLAWTPLRDALRLAIAGLVIAFTGAAVAIWLGNRLDEDDLDFED